MKLLIIEDERDLRDPMCAFLAKAGFVCEEASSLATAEDKLSAYDYDVVVLDLNLPDGNGLRLLEQLKRDHKRSGILIVSARNAVDDRIKGLDLGADDYLTKPFHLAELNARVHAIIRRKAFAGDPLITFHEITIKPAAHQAMVHGKMLDLTRKELDLLLFLVTNRERVLTKAAIAEHLWGDRIDMADNFDFIYTHMKNLRKKIADAGGDDHVRTVYGVGYTFSAA